MIETLVGEVLNWATGRPDVRVVLLIGSHATGKARPDSDIDLILLAEHPQELVKDTTWLNAFGRVRQQTVEDWGRVTSVHAWYADGSEVEFGLTGVDWVARPDEGTRRALADGFRVLLDRDGTFAQFEEH